MNNDLFMSWFTKNWTLKGGLIQPNIAAKALGVTTGRITQMITENKLTRIKGIDNKPYISYAELMQVYENRKKKKHS